VIEAGPPQRAARPRGEPVRSAAAAALPVPDRPVAREPAPRPGRPQPGAPLVGCHPLLLAADTIEPVRDPPRRWVGREAPSPASTVVGAVRVAGARLRGRILSARGSGRRHRGGTTDASPGVVSPRPGRPLIVAVGSGRGGSGRSTVAHGLAARLATDGTLGPVVLVDGDLDVPDLDLRLRADTQPTLADLLDALPEIAAGEGDVDQYLARGPASGLRVLLAPPSRRYRDGIGPEHLDYVLTYLLAPAFAVVVVDLGRGSPLAAAADPRQGIGFWLQRADIVLVPFRGDPSGLRDAQRYRLECARLGVAAEAVWPVLNGYRPRLLRISRLEAQVREVACYLLPWAPDAALRAQVDGRPLSCTDPAMRTAYTRLASALHAWALRTTAGER